jgi:trigger factor
VTSVVEELGAERLRLTLEMSAEEVAHSASTVEEMFERLSYVGLQVADACLSQATVDRPLLAAILARVDAAIGQHRLRLAGRCEVDVQHVGVNGALRLVVSSAVRPDFNLPDLSTVTVSLPPSKPSDREVDTYLDELRKEYVDLTDVARPAQAGDVVRMNLVARIGDELVPGGSADAYEHEVGSGHSLAGLDEALVGMSAGDSVTIATQLVGGSQAGAHADVTVTVLSVHEAAVPELDDEFAAAVGAASQEELRQYVIDSLTANRQAEWLPAVRDAALATLIDQTAFSVPEQLTADDMRQHMHSIQVLGRPSADAEADLRAIAVHQVRVRLILDEIADSEGIVATWQDLLQTVLHRARKAGVSPEEYLNGMQKHIGVPVLYADARRAKALAFLMERIHVTTTP